MQEGKQLCGTSFMKEKKKSVGRLALEYFLCGKHMIIGKILRGRESKMDSGKSQDRQKTKKRIREMVLIRGIFLLLTVCMLPGCAVRMQKTGKIRDLEFVVADKDDVPEEFRTLIEENRDTPVKMTYADRGKLYIAEGYGPQPTSGYSVEVEAVYETRDAVYIHTNLLGPEKGEETKEVTTYPYVVVQLEYIEKDILFD